MVLLPIAGETGQKIMKANPGVFHNTAYKKGSYPGVGNDIPAIAITAVLTAMDKFPQDRMYQIVNAVFANLTEISAVWKDALKLTPESSIKQMSPDAVKYLHPGSLKFFKEKGALR
jgi:TRAP-type uncharacterized transport system substrate-binding protein